MNIAKIHFKTYFKLNKSNFHVIHHDNHVYSAVRTGKHIQIQKGGQLPDTHKHIIFIVLETDILDQTYVNIQDRFKYRIADNSKLKQIINKDIMGVYYNSKYYKNYHLTSKIKLIIKTEVDIEQKIKAFLGNTKLIDFYDKITKYNSKIDGMLNSGNNCFINSSLQSLYYIPEFRNLIMGQSIEIETKNKTLELYLGKYSKAEFNMIHDLGQYYRDRQAGVSICEYVKHFHTRLSFTLGRQEDASEFLQNLFKLIMNNTKTCLNVTLCELFHNNVTTKSYYLYDDKKYDNVSSIYQLTLILIIKDNLQQSIDVNFKNEVIDDYKIQIKSSIHRTKLYRSYTIDSISPYLIIQLKRFNYIAPASFKITKRMNMPLKFIMNPEYITDTTKKVEYTLIGFIEHIGKTLMNGHYINYQIINNRWYRFSDSRVNILNKFPDTSKGYIYFYKKNKISID